MKILVGQRLICFLFGNVTQCSLRDAVNDLFYDHVMTKEAIQAQVTKSCMATVGMASQSLILRARGSCYINWLMYCSSVTYAPRNVTITSLHAGEAIQHVLCQKSLSKLVTDVMSIFGEEVAL